MRYPINELIQREMMRDNSHLKPSLVQLLLKERERCRADALGVQYLRIAGGVDTQKAELNEQVSDYFKEPTEVTHMRRAHLIDRSELTQVWYQRMVCGYAGWRQCPSKISTIDTTTGEVVTVAIVRRRGVLLLPGLGSPEKAEFSRWAAVSLCPSSTDICFRILLSTR